MNASAEHERHCAGRHRVIDFTQVMMGPVCTQMLGDYGADVVKIERAGAGDLSRRRFRPPTASKTDLLQLKRNKRRSRSTCAMRQYGGVKSLIAGADVVVNNFRAGVMDRMGLGYDDCRALNGASSMRWARLRRDRSYAHKGAGCAGAGDERRDGAQGDPSHPLATYPTALADYSAGMHMVQGILLALLHRERTGEGRGSASRSYNSMLAMQMQEAAMI
jgi:formyl-CoA transferase